MDTVIALLAVVGGIAVIVLFWIGVWIFWSEVRWRVLARLGRNGQRERDRAAGRRRD